MVAAGPLREVGGDGQDLRRRPAPAPGTARGSAGRSRSSGPDGAPSTSAVTERSPGSHARRLRVDGPDVDRDVEQMDLAVGGGDRAVGRDQGRRVVGPCRVAATPRRCCRPGSRRRAGGRPRRTAPCAAPGSGGRRRGSRRRRRGTGGIRAGRRGGRRRPRPRRRARPRRRDVARRRLGRHRAGRGRPADSRRHPTAAGCSGARGAAPGLTIDCPLVHHPGYAAAHQFKVARKPTDRVSGLHQATVRENS